MCTILFVVGFGTTVSAHDPEQGIPTDIFLLETGMSQEQIDALDADIKEYIVADLKKNANVSDLTYVDSEMISTVSPRVSQSLTGIEFSCPAWYERDVIHLYPTYEFTTTKRPRGQDSFSFVLGDAMMPYNYGGKLWYKADYMEDWESTSNDTLSANTQSMNGAEFSGSQLGTPDSKIYIKGCTNAQAYPGSGTDKRIIMSYMHNPNRSNYSISFSAMGLGISYTAPGTIYTAAKTVQLSY